MPKSLQKYIRKEKARIRRDVLDIKEQEKLINELYQKFSKSNKINPIRKPISQIKNKNGKINKDRSNLSNGVKKD